MSEQEGSGIAFKEIANTTAKRNAWLNENISSANIVFPAPLVGMTIRFAAFYHSQLMESLLDM
jgi:hypothetical protein